MFNKGDKVVFINENKKASPRDPEHGKAGVVLDSHTTPDDVEETVVQFEHQEQPLWLLGTKRLHKQ